MPILLPVHIVAAGLGLITGGVALSVAKGGRLHCKSGLLFVYAIVAMCATAVVSAVVKGQAVNVMAGLMTAYLVLTGLWTVRPPSDGSRRRDIGLMLMALALTFVHDVTLLPRHAPSLQRGQVSPMSPPE